MTARPLTSTAPRAEPLDSSAVAIVIRRVALVTVCRLAALADRRAQRQALRELDDHLLEDVGLSRAEAWREARKPFWRA